MNTQQLQSVWAKKYQAVPAQLEKVKKVTSVATAFNTNIDAVVKISGKQLKKLLERHKISETELQNIKLTSFREPKDALIAIVKCFEKGIAEEWTTTDINVYQWLKKEIGYDRLQMGGQGGIIANAMALLGIKKVITHTNSHPELQAKQFLDLDNLLAFDGNGQLKKATDICRDEPPMIHWIIEFDKGDNFSLGDTTFVCPKSNRFIATYDPLNMNLAVNRHFTVYLNSHKGFHPLLKENNGLKLIKDIVPVIKKWQKANPKMIVHLEVASTQDKAVRKAIIDDIAPISQSIGLNERETLDLLNVLGKKALAQKIEKKMTACNLFEALLFLKNKLKTPRIQLHMFGLYMTLQDKSFPRLAKMNLKGMMTAAVVASSKAANGALTKYQDLTKTLGQNVSEVGLKELTALAEKLKAPELLTTGICAVGDYTLSATPTILVDKPKTLVGMGDTISSVSLIAGR